MMRILFLTNFYPPIRAGGYAQLCYEVAQHLQARHHTVAVLTSRYLQEQHPAEEVGVYRLLHLDGDLYYYRPFDFFIGWKKRQQENSSILGQIVSEFRPDVIMVWSLWAMSTAIAALAEQLLPARVVYYLAGYWPVNESMHQVYWQASTRRGFWRVPKKILAKIALAMLNKSPQAPLNFQHSLCVSAALRDILTQQGLPLQQAQVVYNGIAVEQFLNDELNNKRQNGYLKLLYAGQLVPHKGVHTAIEAVDLLVNQRHIDQLSLTVLGAGHPDYEETLRSLVEQKSLQNYVDFQKAVSREKMPAILRQYDVLVFPSTYDEPLARMIQEAMAAGLTVVGTPTGGTKEILTDGKNGLTFLPGDAIGLADQLARLVVNRDLCGQLAQAGRRTVMERFTISRMVNKIEEYLQAVTGSSTPSLVSTC